MDKIEIKKINDNKYLVNLINGDENFFVSNGMTFDKNDLYLMYIKLRDIFTKGNE